MLFVRSLFFAGLHIVSAIIFSLLAVIVWPLPFKWRYKLVSQWAISNLWLLKIICGIRYEVQGLDNISDEPCIILCKHQSSWETLALQAIFPPQVWVLKRELLWIPFFGWGLASLNPIAIDRGAGRKALNQIIEQGQDRLSSGAWVVIFPEGTRIASGVMGKFGIGGARLAVETGFPVVPIAHDAGKAWPRHGFIKYPGVIKLVIGAKIATEDKTASDLNQQVFEWMESEMTVLEGKTPTLQSRLKGDD
ncbi:MAG: 1-acyl-sn-glycerol-3-phosphate acyltransferase [Gammaproteobacteria bacterium]|nr:MAG: 1-acyl-sn-glycerol-3-phosphate acyltransferase [Gammaproteobacteria bacterium]